MSRLVFPRAYSLSITVVFALLLISCKPHENVMRASLPDHIELRLPQHQVTRVLAADARNSDVQISLGDITWGQVRTSVITVQGESLLAPRSMRPGEHADFFYGRERYRLQLTGLRNRLLGGDYAQFTLARKNDFQTPESPADFARAIAIASTLANSCRESRAGSRRAAKPEPLGRR